MSDSSSQQSPLVQIDLSEFAKASGIELREIPFQGHLNLRGRPDNPAFLAAVTYKAPPNYIWGGFVVGLGVAAILLTWRYSRLSRV